MHVQLTGFFNVSQSGVALRLPPHSIIPRRANLVRSFFPHSSLSYLPWI
jgi:hypothetical protein